ncbi:MAG: molybdopterin converting factor subunit 1 [Gemmatimonadota bacterium]|nr:MAG: molybdopterin converting factor subunit 1 [Gemmatimonadota bacterium]
MRVTAVFFAVYRELAGAEALEVELVPGATVRQLVETLRARPGGDKLPDSPAVAVNQEYAPLDTVLSEGDEVALIPPVAGG